MSGIDRHAAASAIDAFLRAIGRDPAAEPELRGTGARVADAFIDELCAGYAVDVPALLRANVLGGASGLVVVRGIATTTTCPHHLMAAAGTATVAFEPREHVLGIGAVARVVDAFAQRLTLQERIGDEVTRAIAEAIDPEWVACRLVLSHACMTARGERRHGAEVETFSLAGRGAAANRDRAAVAVGHATGGVR
jgi:GTP cyclohydrolase I